MLSKAIVPFKCNSNILRISKRTGGISMILTDSQISELVSKTKDRQISVQNVEFKYSQKTQKLIIDPKGVGNIPHEDDFYENLEFDLSCMDTSCISKMVKRFNTDFTVNSAVLPDGTMNLENLQMDMNITVTSRQSMNPLPLLEDKFQSVAPLFKYATNIEFVYNKYRLCNINLTFNFNLDDVSSQLDKPGYNQTVLNQWLAISSHVLMLYKTQNEEEHTYYCNVPIVKGQLCFENRMESLRGYFSYGV